MPKPTIVLVHGAWADGASWNAVSTELQGQGFTVLTPPNLLHGVAGDAAYVASFLTQRTTGPVVLVGHSYGGVVITNAGAAGGDVKARAPRSTSRTRTSFSTSSVTPELRKGTPRHSSSHRPSTSPSRKTSLKRTGG